MALETTLAVIDQRFPIGEVDPRIFGGFAEHMGRCIYEGLYDPKSPKSDAEGWRTDVLDALAPLGFSTMRYPGGNFASGYNWKDGIGPRQHRPVRREGAWRSLESNQVGTDEFVALCQRMGWQPMVAFNLGLGTPREALDWFEYIRAPREAAWGSQRPSDEPYPVALWCLGNEMDGPWQLGHTTPEDYARRARMIAKAIKDAEPGHEVVYCGSSGDGMSTFAAWDEAVLETAGDSADFISLHRYSGNREDSTPRFLAEGERILRQIDAVDAVCRTVQAKTKSPKRARLCFDEWNVWYKAMGMSGEWKAAPHLIEEVYNLEDALVVAEYLHSFLQRADVLKAANLAQIVNVIAPVLTRTDGLLIQSIYYPFLMVSRRRGTHSLKAGLCGPGPDDAQAGARFINASATWEEGRVHLFLTNRSLDSEAPVEVELLGVRAAALASAEIVTGSDPKAANSWDNPDCVKAVPFGQLEVTEKGVRAVLPPMSFVAATVEVHPE